MIMEVLFIVYILFIYHHELFAHNYNKTNKQTNHFHQFAESLQPWAL